MNGNKKILSFKILIAKSTISKYKENCNDVADNQPIDSKIKATIKIRGSENKSEIKLALKPSKLIACSVRYIESTFNSATKNRRMHKIIQNIFVKNFLMLVLH
jgi:hypothetical protein